LSKCYLDGKNVDIKLLAGNILNDEILKKELMDGLLSENNIIKKNCFKTLELVSEENPFFYILARIILSICSKVNLIFIECIAIYLLANLTAVGEEK